MYNVHAKAIQDYSKLSADNLVDIILMVVLSIQQNWGTVGRQMLDVKEHGADSKFLWGSKRNAYKYLQRNKHFMHSQYLAVCNSNKSDAEKAMSLMKIFLRVPNLGLAKAGFVCQMTEGLVGCIDTHNIKMYGIDEKHLKLAKSVKSESIRRSKIDQYIRICHSIGTEQLWNNWCNFLGDRDKYWQDGYQVSEAHYNYLIQ